MTDKEEVKLPREKAFMITDTVLSDQNSMKGRKLRFAKRFYGQEGMGEYHLAKAYLAEYKDHIQVEKLYTLEEFLEWLEPNVLLNNLVMAKKWREENEVDAMDGRREVLFAKIEKAMEVADYDR